MSTLRATAALVVLGALSLGTPGWAQHDPRARRQPRGLGVSPAFEGWYVNPDGSYTLSFGFINRNTEERIEIPVGARNAVSPDPPDRGQPTRFPAGRHYGVFTLTVPAGFSREDRITWTRSRAFMIATRDTLRIPPHSTPIFSSEHVLRTPVRLQSFQAHMHRRGKGMSMEAIYPDGRTELLSQIDNFQHNWFNNYIYSDDAAPLLPAGTVLKFHAWFDNTENNPHNPHPGDFVTWGDRAVDEMGHAWASVNELTQEQYEALVAEREGRAPRE